MDLSVRGISAVTEKGIWQKNVPLLYIPRRKIVAHSAQRPGSLYLQFSLDVLASYSYFLLLIMRFEVLILQILPT